MLINTSEHYIVYNLIKLISIEELGMATKLAESFITDEHIRIQIQSN